VETALYESMPRAILIFSWISRSGDAHSERILRAFEQPLQLVQCRYFPSLQMGITCLFFNWIWLL